MSVSPTGAAIGAFFDLDGTLIPLPSLERRFLRHLLQRGRLRPIHGLRWLARFGVRLGRGLLLPNEALSLAWLAATEGNKAYLAGVPERAVEEFARAQMDLAFAKRSSTSQAKPQFFPAALLSLARHAAQGHRLFVVTGTPRPFAQAVAQTLDVPVHVLAAELETRQGCLTGRANALGGSAFHCGESLSGLAKARALEWAAGRYDLDLGRSFAYGDRWSDRWMLERVGHPVAVNPSPWLKRLARRRGWTVVRWGHGNAAATRCRTITQESKA